MSQVKKPKRKKLRFPMTKNIFFNLMESPKIRKHRYESYYRFRICCVILYATGLRLSDCALLTYQNIRDLQIKGMTQIIVQKTNRALPVMISTQSKQYLLNLQTEIECLFSKINDKTLQICHTKNTKLFNYWFNKQLQLYLHQMYILNPLIDINLPLNLYKSHSFRIGRVTRLLNGKVPIQEVSAIMGHRHIQTTLRYHRFHLFENNYQQKISKIEDDSML